MLPSEHYLLRALVSNMIKYGSQNNLPPKCYEHSDGSSDQPVLRSLTAVGYNNTSKGVVYAIQAKTLLHIKIGHSWSAEHRLAQLKGASPDELKIIATWPGTEDDERSLHRALKPWRLHCEWFEPSAAVVEAIQLCYSKQRTVLREIDLAPFQIIRRIQLEARSQGGCCFCGKLREEVFQLVEGNDVWICEGCVEFCNQSLFDRKLKVA
jgi:hypothetical protein